MGEHGGQDGQGKAGKRVIVIGLDGATFDLIKPWVREGKLPGFAKLMREGAHGELRSTIHPMSSVAWPSFMTGKNPGKHGVFDVTEPVPNSYHIRFTRGGAVHGRTLWQALSESGKRVGVVDVPMTYPPEAVNGFLISGMDAPGPGSCFMYPQELYEELRAAIGSYRFEQGPPLPNKGLGEYLATVEEILENRWQVTQYLRRRYACDLFMAVFVAPDRVQHYFWKYMQGGGADPTDPESARYRDTIFGIYKRLDGIIEELCAGLDRDDVLICMSDHGAGPVAKFINLNRWLAQEGLLVIRHTFPFALARGFWRGLKRSLSARLKVRIKRLFPALHPAIMSYLFFSRIDWARTKAYSRGYFGDICINLRGREPQGVVEPGRDYEALRGELIAKLAQLLDPETGEPLVETVYRREEIYHGEQIGKAPDLVIRWKDYKYKSRVNLELDEAIVSAQPVDALARSRSSSIHRLQGILLAMGGDIRKGVEIAGAEIIDLAPTILHLMGQPIPTDMDGKVLTALFEEDFVRRYPLSFASPPAENGRERGEGYSPEEARQIQERLARLGYLE